MQPFSKSFSFKLLLLGTIALAIALYHNYLQNHTPVTFAYDSENYRQASSMVAQIWRGAITDSRLVWNLLFAEHFCIPAQLAPQLLSSAIFFPDFLDHIRLDGPVLPFVFGSLAFLWQKFLLASDWRTIVVAQSLMYAVTVMLVGIIADNISKNKTVALTAAALYLLYPPACLATNRFLTENLAVLLVTAFLALLTAPNLGLSRLILIGLTGGWLFLLRPGEAFAVALPILVFCCGRRDRFKNRLGILTIIVGTALLSLLPWIIFSTIFLPHPLLSADRTPALSLAIGMDIETDGTAPIFAGPLAALVIDHVNPWHMVLGLISASPLAYIKFFIWKLEAMIFFPWNDFNHKFLGMAPEMQLYLHWIYLCLALFGTITTLVKSWRDPNGSNVPFYICVSFAAGQLILIFFITSSRYLFPVMPLLAVLAAGALQGINNLPKLTLRRCAIACLAIIFAFRVSYRAFSPAPAECAIKLTPGSALTRHLDFSFLHKPTKFDTVLLLVDGDHSCCQAEIFINNKKLPGRLTPLYDFDADEYSPIALNEIETAAHRRNLAGLNSVRLWRAVVIPKQWLRPGDNTFAIRATNSNSIIFAGTNSNERRLPSLLLYSDDNFWRDPRHLDGRPTEPVLAANVAGAERFILVEPGRGNRLLQISPRIKLLFVNKVSTAPGITHGCSFSRRLVL